VTGYKAPTSPPTDQPGYKAPTSPPTDQARKKASENNEKSINGILCGLLESYFVKVMNLIINKGHLGKTSKHI